MKLVLVLALIGVCVISTNCQCWNCKRDEIEDDIIPQFEDIEERYSTGHQRRDERQRRIESDLRSCGFNCKRDEIKRKRRKNPFVARNLNAELSHILRSVDFFICFYIYI